MFEDFKLKTFLDVIETGSFTQTSKNLDVSQPAVSQNIADLEKSIGVQLFDRHKGGVSPTATGIAFKRYAENILYWYNAAENMFGQAGKAVPRNRPIKILAPRVANDYILASALTTIKAATNINFEIEELQDNKRLEESNQENNHESNHDTNRETNQKSSNESNHENKQKSSNESNQKTESKANADILLYTTSREEMMNLVTGESFIGLIQACAISSSESKFASLSKIEQLPENSSLYIWKEYYENLPYDLKAKVSIVSESIELIINMIASSPNAIGIIPRQAIDTATKNSSTKDIASQNSRKNLMPVNILPINFPYLQLDLHFKAKNIFSLSPLCDIIKRTLIELMQ